MLVKNDNLVEGTIVAPDGSVANKPTLMFTAEEARLLRTYKKFLDARGLKEALYCSACWSRELSDGCEAHVTDNTIGVICRCTTRLFLGPTY